MSGRLEVELLGLDDLVLEGTVDIAWDRENPRNVRLAGGFPLR